MTDFKFSEKTYKYFSAANKNKNSKEWFLKNKSIYEQHVKKPFEKVLTNIEKKLQRDLIGIPVKGTSITRPVRPSNRAKEGLVKDFSNATLSEKRSSLFEWNPAIYIHFSSTKDDNFVAIGLYMVSSRQTSLLRNAIATGFETIDEILNTTALKKTWGQLQGDRYVRYPKGFAIDQPYSKLLMHKQFYLIKHYTKTQIFSKKFSDQVVRDIQIALPFFKWDRKTVGVYHR